MGFSDTKGFRKAGDWMHDKDYSALNIVSLPGGYPIPRT